MSHMPSKLAALRVCVVFLIAGAAISLVACTSPEVSASVPAGSVEVSPAICPSGAIAVPGLLGLTEDDTKAVLVAAGFTDVRVTHQINGSVPAGTVFMQSPEPGTLTNCVDAVFIYVADAPVPTAT